MSRETASIGGDNRLAGQQPTSGYYRDNSSRTVTEAVNRYDTKTKPATTSVGRDRRFQRGFHLLHRSLDPKFGSLRCWRSAQSPPACILSIHQQHDQHLYRISDMFTNQ